MSNLRNDHSVVQENNSPKKSQCLKNATVFLFITHHLLFFKTIFSQKTKNKSFFNFSVRLEMKQHQLTQKSKSLFYNKHLFCPEIESIFKLFTRVHSGLVYNTTGSK